MKTKHKTGTEGAMELVDKEKKRLQKLEALMGAFVKGTGQILSDDEIRELCMLRARYKKENE